MASENEPKHINYGLRLKLYLSSILYIFQKSLLNYQESIIILILYLNTRMVVNHESERSVLG